MRTLCALIVASLTVGCANMMHKSKEHDISMDQMSPPARSMAQKVTAGGHVDKVTEEIERNRKVYDVEATVNGRHMEYLIAADDGSLLGTESPINFSEAPQPVRDAAVQH